MTKFERRATWLGLAGLGLGVLAGCTTGPLADIFTGGDGTVVSATPGAFTPEGSAAFTQELIQARTFTDGRAVTTTTHLADDMTRRPLAIDFNADGKVDPVVAYGATQAVIQILLSQGGPGVTQYLSLTLDSKRDMEDLADLAVGDIDGDGALDIIGAAEASLWYFHHPSGQPTTNLSAWGNPNPSDELRERIDASYVILSDAELQAIIAQALGPGVNLDDYIVTIEQLYTNVEIGDMDRDGDNDLAASRLFRINLQPKPEVPVPPLLIVDGDVLVFLNPGFAADGHNWTAVSIGRHERQLRLDRDGATGLLMYDLDGDGDLDLVSTARDDNNVQVAWFENPGFVVPDQTWSQWRIGSIRDAYATVIADVTNDGRPDVIATGGAQMQMMLFEQPTSGPKRAYDWDTHVLVTFESFEPRDVRAFDVDRDGVLELVCSGTGGAVRYFERQADPRSGWTGVIVTDFDPPGEVGLLGYGDLDGDGDLDLVAVVNNDEDNDERVIWIRNGSAAVGL
ncbi:MAG: FG-GAP repeat domain-containing protein [Phycisphaerae bacterium]